MILFFSEQQVAADIFIKNLSWFLNDQIIERLFLENFEEYSQPDLLIIDGYKIHPQRLNKISRNYPNVPLILISDRKIKSLAVTTVISESISVRDIADICRLILKKTIVRQRINLHLVEEVLLRKLVEGASNKEISRESGLDPSTVKYHLRNIYSKMGVKNRTQAAMIADKFIL